MTFLRSLATRLGQWPVALAACALLAAAVLLPRLGTPGLWEPQERQLADRVAPPLEAEAKLTPPQTQTPATPAPACERTVPPDATARSLTPKAIRWGRDTFGDSDTGRRLPLALLGLLTVLAAAGTAIRLAGARAGILTAAVLLAMPLMTLQSRMLTSEIGTACGASLIIYGFVTLQRFVQRIDLWAILDALVGLVALAAGIAIGFYGGGALLGVLVPIGAVAAAGSFGAPAIASVVRRREIGSQFWPAVVATLLAGGLVALLAYQLYDLKQVVPGLTPPPAREVLGKAIIPNGCYSWALGGIYKADDDLRMIFDSSWEQIAYGSYPWGVLAPIAMVALLYSKRAQTRLLGALTLAWAGAAWIATEVFLRKVGFTIFAGFPALAIAVGTWLDDVFARRKAGDADAMPAGVKLVALFALLAAIDLGKDMQSFAERLTSLFVGSDAVPYPMTSRLLWLPTKLWVLIFGTAIAVAFVVALVAWGKDDGHRDARPPRPLRWLDALFSVRGNRLATLGATLAVGLTILFGAFWSAIWQPRLAYNLSSKEMFQTVQRLAQPGDDLVVMGDLGQAPLAYTDKQPQVVTDRSQVITALGRPNRVFAIAPQGELCGLHREIGGKPYYVIDDRNTRNLLLSNKLDGATDNNPLREAIVHTEPTNISHKPKGRVVWDGRIQLLGWDLPASVGRGEKFTVRLYYKILQPVGGAWTTLMHFDGAIRFNGDHKPINDRCPTSTWQPGDYIIDTYTLIAGGGAFPSGPYEVWTGFFTGSAPNWKNMPVSEAPGDMRDTADRVKITSLDLE